MTPTPGYPAKKEVLIANLTYDERMKYGKADELEQVECLRRNGHEIEEVSSYADMIEKIDRYEIVDGQKIPVQIKCRDRNSEMSEVYTDILIDYYEPYGGLGHSDTRIGRDQKSSYQKFTVRIKDSLYLVDGETQKLVVANVMDEWASCYERERVDDYLARWIKTLSRDEEGIPIWKKASIFERFSTMRSQRYTITDNGKRIEVKCTQDRRNKRPKLLIFIPPAIYTMQQVRKYTMVTNG